MCELMALSFARPASADFSIRAFALRGTENADGWGLAWYPDRSLALVKEPLQWGASPFPHFLESYPHLVSAIYLAHVRHRTTGGKPTHADTHPFARELGGRMYCFAHNGTLLGFDRLALGRFHPAGATDSEHAFCHLLDLVARERLPADEDPRRADPLGGASAWRWLRERLAGLNRMGKLNCLLADGRRLFCYHDAAGHKGLHFRAVRVRDPETRRLEDPTMEINLGGPAFNQGFVVATCPLSAAGWHSFRHGELLVFEEGRVCFSSARSTDDPAFAFAPPGTAADAS